MRERLKPLCGKRCTFTATVRLIKKKKMEYCVALETVCHQQAEVTDHAWVYVAPFHPLAGMEGERVVFTAQVDFYFKKGADHRLIPDYCLKDIRDVVVLNRRTSSTTKQYAL